MNADVIRELDKILPVVARVHGDGHPELYRVLELYTALKEQPDKAHFTEMRQLTGNFTLPEDACPTYEKAFRDLMLLEAELA